ncbi:MAG: hypothetical protein KDD53_00385, partial [Bdellovibrionales bacterium]|nr:hypothetical protein [Bdellovibrionales bacterium]
MPASVQIFTPSGKYFIAGISISILIHILLLAFAFRSIESYQGPRQVFEVTFLPESALKPTLRRLPQQIVSPSQTSKPIPKDHSTPLLSDRDSFAEKEQLKRGDDPQAGRTLSKNPNSLSTSLPANKPSNRDSPQHKPPAPQSAPKKSSPLRELLLDSDTLAREFASPASEKPLSSGSKVPNEITPPTNHQPFSRAPGSGAAIIGLAGSADYLPNLPDGDITLLNAKAARFAVFVRRIASKVFGQMRQAGWDNLLASDISRIRDFCTIHATLDLNGEL